MTRSYAAMPLDDDSLKDDTKFQALSVATKNLWTTFPERREEWMRPYLNQEKGDLTRKSIMLGLLANADWNKDLSDMQRSKLEALISDEIKIEKSNLISTLCQVVEKQKLKSAIPALKLAATSRKEGSYNWKKIEAVIEKLDKGK